MSLRTLIASCAVLVAIAAGYAAGVHAERNAPTLRSEHSEPAATLPSGMVAVTPEGKTFHKPACTFIHGKSELISAQKAVSEGYTPCIRCMRETLEH